MLTALASMEDEVGQALVLLGHAGVEDARSLSLGEGDRRLLELHRRLTGTDVELVAHCGACETASAIVLSPESLPPTVPRVARLGGGGGLREPTYADLVDLPANRREGERELLRRCTVGEPSREPTADDLALVDDSLAGPLVVRCPGCDAEVEAPLDVQRVVLESLDRELDAIEHEVHLLARAYHWDLAAIEALPDERRSRLASFVVEGR